MHCMIVLAASFYVCGYIYRTCVFVITFVTIGISCFVCASIVIYCHKADSLVRPFLAPEGIVEVKDISNAAEAAAALTSSSLLGSEHEASIRTPEACRQLIVQSTFLAVPISLWFVRGSNDYETGDYALRTIVVFPCAPPLSLSSCAERTCS